MGSKEKSELEIKIRVKSMAIAVLKVDLANLIARIENRSYLPIWGKYSPGLWQMLADNDIKRAEDRIAKYESELNAIKGGK